MTQSEYKLTYFDIRGLGEPIRLIFALKNVPYEDIRIPHKPAIIGLPSPIPPEVKQRLPFGQLPTLQVDGQCLSQSIAISRFLARKFNLYGADEWEAAKMDEIVESCMDYFHDFRRNFRSASNEEERSAVVLNTIEVSTPKYFGKLNQLLEQNGGNFIVGKSVSWADCVVFHTTTNFGNFIGGLELFENYPAIKYFIESFSAIPAIRKWLDERPQNRY